jgi:phage terminase small subunit
MPPRGGGRRRGAGRKPKPAKLRLLEGNPGKRPIKEGTTVAPFCPDRPKWTAILPNAKGKRSDSEAQAVRRDAQAAWDAVIVQLDQIGVLGRVDMTVVTDYCVCESRLRQCIGELGLSPSSRVRLNTTGGGSVDDEDEEELFG